MKSRVYADIGTSVWRAFLAAAAPAVLFTALLRARWRPSWYEELFTLQVVGEASLGETVCAPIADADPSPPVGYFLRHLNPQVRSRFRR